MAAIKNHSEIYRRLQPDKSERDAALMQLVKSLGQDGEVFHVLRDIPEQGEDVLTILCDDHTVVSFDLPYGRVPLEAEEVVITPVAEYRHEIGQGKSRIGLDETLKYVQPSLGK